MPAACVRSYAGGEACTYMHTWAEGAGGACQELAKEKSKEAELERSLREEKRKEAALEDNLLKTKAALEEDERHLAEDTELFAKKDAEIEGLKKRSGERRVAAERLGNLQKEHEALKREHGRCLALVAELRHANENASELEERLDRTTAQVIKDERLLAYDKEVTVKKDAEIEHLKKQLAAAKEELGHYHSVMMEQQQHVVEVEAVREHAKVREDLQALLACVMWACTCLECS